MTRRMFSAVLLALLLGACSARGIPIADPSEEARGSVDLAQSGAPPPASDVADVVERVLPSVVNVRVTSLIGDPLGGTSEAEGQGSGVIIDSKGIIVTNAHVVANAVEVEVVFNDDEHEPMEGIVVGTVPEKDLAVIRVDADDLDPVELGKSANLRLGDSVVALGFPLGLGGATVTQGIISGNERTIEPAGSANAEPVRLEGLLQTDAAINPGNSGGALVDMSGRLVGINTAAAQAATAENIGFAIAIDSAVPVIEEILNEPHEERAWMGVILRTVDEIVAPQLGLPDVRGVLIVDVVAGGPAEEADVEEGEVITAIAGESVTSIEGVSRVLADFAPGDRVEVTLVSSEGERGVELELEPRPQTIDEN